MSEFNDLPELDAFFDIPEGCESCPKVQELIGRLSTLEMLKEDRTSLAMDGDSIDVLSGYLSEMLDVDHGDEHEHDKQEMAARLRGGIVREITFIDVTRDEIIQEGTLLTAACNGIVKARFQKDGVLFNIKLCNSPIRPRDEVVEEIIIDRKDI